MDENIQLAAGMAAALSSPLGRCCTWLRGLVSVCACLLYMGVWCRWECGRAGAVCARVRVRMRACARVPCPSVRCPGVWRHERYLAAQLLVFSDHLLVSVGHLDDLALILLTWTHQPRERRATMSTSGLVKRTF